MGPGAAHVQSCLEVWWCQLAFTQLVLKLPPPTRSLPQLEAEASGQQVEAHQRVLRFDAGYSLLGTAVNAPPQEADAAERREWLLLAAAALKAAGEELAAQQITAALGPLASRGPPTAASKSGARR